MADLESRIAADEREDRRLARESQRAGQSERRESLQTCDGWADLGVQARWSGAREERR